MSPFEYIIPLVSVLVGLAVADLATSLHGLLRARNRVQWDWLPLATAVLAILTVLNIWWGLYGAQDDTFYRTLAGFLPLAAQLVLLFLINAAALPDKIPPEGIDLKAFYEGNNSYFWSLFAAYVFVIIFKNAVDRLTSGLELFTVLKFSIPNFILIAFFISLIFIKKRIYHAIIIIALLILYITQWSGMHLGAV